MKIVVQGKRFQLWELKVDILQNLIPVYDKLVREKRQYKHQRNNILHIVGHGSRRNYLLVLALLKRELRYRTYPEYRVWIARLRDNKEAGDFFADWLDENLMQWDEVNQTYVTERGFQTMARRLRRLCEEQRKRLQLMKGSSQGAKKFGATFTIIHNTIIDDTIFPPIKKGTS